MPRRSSPALSFTALPVLLALLALITAPAAAADGLDLHGERFHVTVEWRTPDGTRGIGHPVPSTQQSGFFWFFSPSNLELMVKVLDACAISQRYWVFAAGMTDVEVTLTVEDRWSGDVKRYQRAGGSLFAPIADTSSFDACSTTAPSCGHGDSADILASPRPDPHAEGLALVLGDGVAAEEALYQRLHVDLEAIRAADAELADSVFFNVWWGDSSGLLMLFDNATWPSVRNGTYRGWDCVNTWYRGTVTHLFVYVGRIAAVDLEGSVRPNHLLADYASLPGVTHVELDRPVFPACEWCGPPYGMCATSADGVTYDYFIDEMWEYPYMPRPVRYYRVAAPGAVPVLIGRWDRAEAPPPWKPSFDDCYLRLDERAQRGLSWR